jgi:D-amino peptidase
MKILISADMEGISGVVDPTHVNSTHPEYQRFRQIMTDDVNAAVWGAMSGGATEVVVSDAHGNKTNILVEKLAERAELNSGGISPFGMIQGVEDRFDAAMFIGYHACMGTPMAILSHTISGARVANIWLNDRLTGEFGLNASVCGYYGTPVILVSGDLAACQEAEAWALGIEQVVVKKATSRQSARCLPALTAQRLIEQTAANAVKRFVQGNGPKPIKTSEPVKIVLELIQAAQADLASGLPGAVRLDGRRVQIPAGDMPAAYRALRAAINLANA